MTLTQKHYIMYVTEKYNTLDINTEILNYVFWQLACQPACLPACYKDSFHKPRLPLVQSQILRVP